MENEKLENEVTTSENVVKEEVSVEEPKKVESSAATPTDEVESLDDEPAAPATTEASTEVVLEPAQGLGDTIAPEVKEAQAAAGTTEAAPTTEAPATETVAPVEEAAKVETVTDGATPTDAPVSETVAPVEEVKTEEAPAATEAPAELPAEEKTAEELYAESKKGASKGKMVGFAVVIIVLAAVAIYMNFGDQIFGKEEEPVNNSASSSETAPQNTNPPVDNGNQDSTDGMDQANDTGNNTPTDGGNTDNTNTNTPTDGGNNDSTNG